MSTWKSNNLQDKEKQFPTEGPKIFYIQGNLHACKVCFVANALHVIGDTKMENLV